MLVHLDLMSFADSDLNANIILHYSWVESWFRGCVYVLSI